MIEMIAGINNGISIWTNIVEISANELQTITLKSADSVIKTVWNEDGRGDV